KEIIIDRLHQIYQEMERIRPGIIIYQDNARAHPARFQKNCFERLAIRVLTCPSNSPDLNTIEGFWQPLRVNAT
ncbi:hypothetical protein K469DRAFT_520110, partial [Zopfia rhizophila CBS 207.26]